jgi:2-dehydro-3-deoxyphosphooctonate aldolase (KDO 8-P synthase)
MKIIAGPCQHESLEHSLKIASHCKTICEQYGIHYYFKASYDKANRTSLTGKRGQGIDNTLLDFREIKKLLGVNILTDVHETIQVNYIEKMYKDVVDVYQIPAFLCRQTDLILEACKTGKVVNIKKGQFLAPWDVKGILSKTQEAKEVWVTERGTSFGYNTLVVDFTGLDYLLDNFSNIVYDVTHSVQKPGGKGTSSDGNRGFVPGLCRAASALGVENFFLEVHDDPDNAPSDGANMIELSSFDSIVEQIVKYNHKR